MIGFLLGIPFLWWMVILATLFIIDVACFTYEAYGWSLSIMALSIAGAIYLDHHTAAPWLATNLHGILLYYIPGYLALGLGTALIKWVLYAAKRVGWIKEAKHQFDEKEFKPEKPDFSDKAKLKTQDEMHAELIRINRFDHGQLTDAQAGNRADTMGKFNARAAELEAGYDAAWTATIPALKRKAFIDFYQHGMSVGMFGAPSNSKHKIYDVNHAKETSVIDALAPRAKDNIGKITIWIFQWPVVIVSSLIEDLIIKLAKHFATALDAMFSRVVRGMVAKVTKGL